MDLTRHSTIVKPWEHKHRITIIGCGATGSFVFMGLAALGFTNITVVDFDNIEAHNLANQAFNHNQIGKPKVEALRELYELKTGEPIPGEMEFVNAKLPVDGFTPAGYIFLLTDSMASRKEIFTKCLENNPHALHLIETRMASTHGNIFSVNLANPLEAKAWFETLSDDETTELSPCGTSISVGMTAQIIANMAIWQFIHEITETQCGNKALDLFFKPTFVVAKNLEY